MRHIGHDARVTGVDNSAQQLATARRLASQHGIDLTLEEATAYCADQVDGQIAHAIAEAESGLLTTARDIDDAVRELMLTGWYFWASCVSEPAARDAFVCEIYARARLTEAVMRKINRPIRPQGRFSDG
jgi:hypothetical protein